MRLIDRFRASPQARLLRKNDALVFRMDVPDWRVQEYVREWSPGAARTPDGVVPVTESLVLHGPLRCDDDLRRQAELPADAVTAYAVAYAPGQVPIDWTGPDLVAGLARRLDGRIRQPADRSGQWQKLGGVPVQPRVHAAGRLPAERVSALLAPYLPGLRPEETSGAGRGRKRNHGEQAMWESDKVGVLVASGMPDQRFPLIRHQPWFISWADVSEYALFVEDFYDFRGALEQALAAADALVAATGGLLLDEDGFPWSDRS
jgi:hypothetical protein